MSRTVTFNTHRLTLVGRDTCTGTCETHAGCDCIAQCRQCPATTPAEACTDAGFEDEYPMPMRDRLAIVGIYAASAAIVVSTIFFAIY